MSWHVIWHLVGLACFAVVFLALGWFCWVVNDRERTARVIAWIEYRRRLR